MLRRRPSSSAVRLFRPFACVLSILFASASFANTSFAKDGEGRGEKTIQFNRDVRPILSDKCFACHGPDDEHRSARLRFDDEESAKGLKKNKKKRAIIPGDPDASRMIIRILEEDPDERMPPPETEKTISPEELAILRKWIEGGAEYQGHWSYEKPVRAAKPKVKNAAWGAGTIDAFVLAKLEAEGLAPSPEADRVTLLRRWSFDLTGLPPTPEEIDAFLADKRTDALERQVDHLLSSHHYGERMALFWLDLVRYADTVGYHGDQDHASSPYRDWVIDAFNRNLPFDQFTIEQLAGDLLPNPTEDQRIATAYNRLLQTTHEGGFQIPEYLAKYFADRVRNVSAVWMGATVGCAECHNHKYDPYTQKDFYSLGAFFADVDELKTFRGTNSLPTKREPEMEVVSPLDRAEAVRLAKEIEALKNGAASKERIAELEKQRKDLLARKRRVMITKSVKPREIRVLARGDWMDKSGEIVEPRPPTFVYPFELEEKRRATRLDLAEWLTAKDHPQTARVFVNRVWAIFFGGGLSRDLDDTGSQGQWPSHPKLLDWLAVEFVESGWDVKHLVKLIVTSKTYRQSSRVSKALAELDPANALLARQARHRLPAELIRDNALAVSGLLVRTVGGGRSRPYQPSGYYAHLNFPQRKYTHDKGDSQYRRAVYMHWQRQFLHPMLRAFDAPMREECTAQRPTSNTPLAALTLLNDPTFVEAARVFAARIRSHGNDETSTADRVKWAWREVLGRAASEREVKIIAAYFDSERKSFAKKPEEAKQLLSVGLAPKSEVEGEALSELAAWTSVARALLNLNETITRN